MRRCFQAIRIEVNAELESLPDSIDAAIDATVTGGRVAVLSYHSGEDRIVKETFRERVRDGIYRALAKGAVVASSEEIAQNPRARSVRLRAVARKGAIA